LVLLKNPEARKKFILSITDAFTKYVQLVALPNKEEATLAEALFDHRILPFWSSLGPYH
jgi:hypothetical protein